MNMITIHHNLKNSNPIFQQYEIGPIQNLLYLIGDPKTGTATLVDPAWDVPFLLSEIQKFNLTLTQIFLTHGHPDHVNGIPELVARYPHLSVYLGENEPDFLTPTAPNLIRTTNGTVLHAGGVEWTCIFTPGHTPGGQCFYSAPHLITGDTLFVNGCGRCDLPGGDAETLFSSLEILKTLPDDTKFYPGHSYSDRVSDTLGNQKITNPYFRDLPKNKFLDRRGR